MDFDFSDDQESLRDAVRRWVDKGFSFERRHGIAKAGGRTREVYAELAELGLTLITCGGAFSRSARHYQDNLIITATPAT